MSVRDLDWIEGAPEKMEPGMVPRFEMGQVTLIEHSDQFFRDGRFSSVRVERVRSHVVAWARAIKAHDFDWLASMAKARGRKA